MYVVGSVRCFGCPAFPYPQGRDLRRPARRPLARGRLRDGRHRAAAARARDRGGWGWPELSTIDAGGRRRDAGGGGCPAPAGGVPQQLGRQAGEPAAALPASADTRRPGASSRWRYMQDVGQTFGPKSIDLDGWARTPVWSDPATCRVSMRGLPWDGSDLRGHRDLRGRAALPRRAAAAAPPAQIARPVHGARASPSSSATTRGGRRRVDRTFLSPRRPDRRPPALPALEDTRGAERGSGTPTGGRPVPERARPTGARERPRMRHRDVRLRARRSARAPARDPDRDRRAVGRRHLLLPPRRRAFRVGPCRPARRASDRPMAMACFRLVTFLPEPPLRSVPRFISCMAFSTFSRRLVAVLALAGGLCVPPWELLWSKRHQWSMQTAGQKRRLAADSRQHGAEGGRRIDLAALEDLARRGLERVLDLEQRAMLGLAPTGPSPGAARAARARRRAVDLEVGRDHVADARLRLPPSCARGT